MKDFAWSQLMRLGLGDLGLPPDTFWSLTPAELMLLLRLGGQEEGISRERFFELIARYPDKGRDK